MYRLDSSGVVKNTLGGGGFPTVYMRLDNLDDLLARIGFDLTAIPIFLTRDSRAASCGARLSMIVSCARFSGSAACSSLSKSESRSEQEGGFHTRQRQLRTALFGPAIAGPMGNIEPLAAGEQRERCIWVGWFVGIWSQENLGVFSHD